MPKNVPQRNFWFLCLCDDRSCKQPTDRQVVASFPLAGFQLYEVAAEDLRVLANPSRQTSLPCISIMVSWLYVLFALFF